MCLALGATGSMLGNHEAFPICHEGPEPLPSPFPNGLALGCASLPHGTKHPICWEKPFVSNQEHCFLLERLHPAWRDFGCSWLGQGSTWGMGQAVGSWRGGRAGRALPVAWGQPPITQLCLGGTALHQQWAHVAALRPYVHMWMALPHAYFSEHSVGLWQRLALPQCLAWQSDTQGLSHPCATQ